MAVYDFTFPWMHNGILAAEIEVRVGFDYSPSTPAYFDRSFGNYLPGDDAELEVTDVWILGEGRNPQKVEAPEWLADLVAAYAVEHKQAEMIDNACEDAWERQQEAADARRDWVRENREEY